MPFGPERFDSRTWESRDFFLMTLSTLINEQDGEASFELAMSTGEYYGLSPEDMWRIVKETVSAVSGWRKAAVRLGSTRREIDRMASARWDFGFETTFSGLSYVRQIQAWKRAVRRTVAR